MKNKHKIEEKVNANGNLSQQAQENLRIMREQKARADAAKMAFEKRFMPQDKQTYKRIVDLNATKMVDDTYREGKKKFCFIIVDPSNNREEEWPVGSEVFGRFDYLFEKNGISKALFEITRQGASRVH